MTLKPLAVSVLLVSLAPVARAGDGAELFPPVADILGESQPLLPSEETADLRDALRDMPPLKAELRALASGVPGRQKGALERLAVRRDRKAAPYIGAILLQVNAPQETRVSAATTLGRIGDLGSVPYLARALRDQAKEVRFAAALALGKMRSLDAVEALEPALHDDPHWWVRYAAAVALGDSKQPSAVPALARSLDEELRWQVRQQAARSLGQIGTRAAVDALGKALSDEDATVRYSAARALGDVGGDRSADILHDAYVTEKDPLPRGQLQASLRRAYRD